MLLLVLYTVVAADSFVDACSGAFNRRLVAGRVVVGWRVVDDRRRPADRLPRWRPRRSCRVVRTEAGAAAPARQGEVRRERRPVDADRRAADAEETTQKELAVAGEQTFVAEAVDEEIDAGVQVRDHRRVQVNGQREHIGLVGHEDDGVRRPADTENDEDDEDHLDLPDRLDNRRLAAPCT